MFGPATLLVVCGRNKNHLGSPTNAEDFLLGGAGPPPMLEKTCLPLVPCVRPSKLLVPYLGFTLRMGYNFKWDCPVFWGP